jgi:hypothetical protein
LTGSSRNAGDRPDYVPRSAIRSRRRLADFPATVRRMFIEAEGLGITS